MALILSVWTHYAHKYTYTHSLSFQLTSGARFFKYTWPSNNTDLNCVCPLINIYFFNKYSRPFLSAGFTCDDLTNPQIKNSIFTFTMAVSLGRIPTYRLPSAYWKYCLWFAVGWICALEGLTVVRFGDSKKLQGVFSPL